MGTMDKDEQTNRAGEYPIRSVGDLRRALAFLVDETPLLMGHAIHIHLDLVNGTKVEIDTEGWDG